MGDRPAICAYEHPPCPWAPRMSVVLKHESSVCVDRIAMISAAQPRAKSLLFRGASTDQPYRYSPGSTMLSGSFVVMREEPLLKRGNRYVRKGLCTLLGHSHIRSYIVGNDWRIGRPWIFMSICRCTGQWFALRTNDGVSEIESGTKLLGLMLTHWRRQSTVRLFIRRGSITVGKRGVMPLKHITVDIRRSSLNMIPIIGRNFLNKAPTLPISVKTHDNILWVSLWAASVGKNSHHVSGYSRYFRARWHWAFPNPASLTEEPAAEMTLFL